jgi:hypothetical protein
VPYKSTEIRISCKSPDARNVSPYRDRILVFKTRVKHLKLAVGSHQLRIFGISKLQEEGHDAASSPLQSIEGRFSYPVADMGSEFRILRGSDQPMRIWDRAESRYIHANGIEICGSNDPIVSLETC